MAWLQNLAGRAEDLLNKIDQNAATVLSESKSSDKDLQVMLDSGKNGKQRPQKNCDTVHEENAVIKEAEINLQMPQNEEYESVQDQYETSVTVLDMTYQHSEDASDDYSKSESQSCKSVSSNNSGMQVQYSEQIVKLESTIESLNQQLLNLQHLYSELRNENSNLKSQIETSNCLVTTAQNTMEHYKARTQRILQEKEDLIKNLNKSSSENTEHLLNKYSDQLKNEIEFQQKKNAELSENLKKVTQENSFLQQQIVLLQSNANQTTQTLQENLMSEKKIRLVAEEECRIKNHDLQLKHQELQQLNHIIQLKNEEIHNLQDAFNRKSNIDFSKDAERQIKSLTDTLFLKQNALETATTEKNALRLQLEKLENEYQNSLVQLERAQVRVVNVNDTDDVKSQVPKFMRVSPLDAEVTRRVKHAYSTLDAISVRTGIFLRRYPVARVVVFCYMICLHFWALIILFLYAPSTR